VSTTGTNDVHATISTHVLDTALGRPAEGVRVTLGRAGAGPAEIGGGVTDADGRVRALVPPGAALEAGTYWLRFAVGEYFARAAREAFYPEVVVTFRVSAGGGHYHVPLLLNPFGYSTYRGS
jgi:5-hydroxyisourate hydrolase